MKEGKCFRCRKHGHRVRDCPSEDKPRKEDDKLTSILIQTIISMMDKKEKLHKHVEEERLIVTMKITKTKVSPIETKMSTMKNLVDKMKAMAKEEKMKFVELMKRERESELLEKETTPMLISPSLDVYSVTATIDSQSLIVPMTISIDDQQSIETDSLFDSGAGGVFIEQNYARKLHLDIKMLNTPVKARNVDGTENKRGTKKSYVDLQFKMGDKDFTERFFLTGLGIQTVILGFPWLKKHNPLVDWQTGQIDWRNKEEDTQTDSKSSIQKEKDVQPNPKPSMKE